MSHTETHPRNTAERVLNVSNLRVRFETYDDVFTAVEGVDLSLLKDKILGLVGESGCGKSVTALSILRLLKTPPARIEGAIAHKSLDLLTLPEAEMRHIRGDSISMIFQEPMSSLNPVMPVGRQIAETIILHRGVSKGAAWKQAVEMLNLVQIPSPAQRAKEYPHRMSGGMRQRVMIAMALACQPEILLADEPTTALDVTIQAQIMRLMLRLKREFKTSILLISHDLALISEMASRVVVMYAGQVVEEARGRELFLNPLHPYTKGLLSSLPVIGQKFSTGKRRLNEIPGVVPSLRDIPNGCRFHPRCSKAMSICREQAPKLIKTSNGIRVRCWLWQ